MPKKAVHDVRHVMRGAPTAARLHHLDLHGPQLTTLALAATDPTTVGMGKAMLGAADPHLLAALDFLLETYAEVALPPAEAAVIREHLGKDKTMTQARKWYSGAGFGLAARVAQEHVASLLEPHGGSMKGWHKFTHFLKKAVMAPIHLLEGGAKTAAHVAESLAPIAGAVSDVASKLPPGTAAAAAAL